MMEGLHIYQLEYADGGERAASMIEHGDVFSHIPHVRISKH